MRDVLPVEMQDDIAGNLIDYSERWRELRTLIDEGVTDIEAGSTVEIDDIGEYINRHHIQHEG